MSGAENLSLDTNIPVYAHDRQEPVKGAQARGLLAQLAAAGKPLISTQVLTEFYWTTTRKLRPPLSHDEACAEVVRLQVLARVAPLTWETVAKALQAVGAYGCLCGMR